MSADMNARPLDGNAIVYCQGAFTTTYGKTAHGLVRFTRRYRVMSVLDSQCEGQDAGEVLDGNRNGIPIHKSLNTALEYCAAKSCPATHFVIGIAPDGGRLDVGAKRAVMAALKAGLNVDSGLHQFLCDDPELSHAATLHGVQMRDIRKPPGRDHLHLFSGRIDKVDALKIAVLGTDSAVGKRTTAWWIVNEFAAQGIHAEMIGTGQTAWMQGTRYGVVMDALVNDFVAGEIEHAVWCAWKEENPRVIVIEGQGSLMNPAYPGGFEILAAGRPDVIVLQHAPARKDYDGFPGYPIQPLARQIQLIELLSTKKVVAVTINHEGIPDDRIAAVCDAVGTVTGLPAFDVLRDGATLLVKLLESYMNK